MRSLLLLRHAKSDWSRPHLDDHDRPLKSRGILAARKMAKLWHDLAPIPDFVICSTATRAVQTWSEIETVWSETRTSLPQVILSPRLYHCEPSVFDELLSQWADKATTVLFVGHNPGMEEWIQRRTGTSVRLPTAALIHLELADGFLSQAAAPASGMRVCGQWRPKELPEP